MRWRRLRVRRPHRLWSTDGDGEPPGDRTADARDRMVTQQLEARGIRDPQLLQAFRTVPRHRFVDEDDAYGDRALRIPAGQTISQPYVVATMTAAVTPDRGWAGARALDVGTGSGYQAAILAELGAEVIGIERHPELAQRATERLAAAGYETVQVVVGDGSRGWPEGRPYRAIIVGAAAPSVPEPLLKQLDPDGGRVVIPVGSRDHQMLTRVERRGDQFRSRTLDPVVFVPLVGEFGFSGE